MVIASAGQIPRCSSPIDGLDTGCIGIVERLSGTTPTAERSRPRPAFTEYRREGARIPSGRGLLGAPRARGPSRVEGLIDFDRLLDQFSERPSTSTEYELRCGLLWREPFTEISH